MFTAFLLVLSMSLSVIPVFLLVFLVRGIFLHRMPLKYSYLLWAVVGLRLVCPFFLPASFSLFNFSEDVHRKMSQKILSAERISTSGNTEKKAEMQAEKDFTPDWRGIENALLSGRIEQEQNRSFSEMEEEQKADLGGGTEKTDIQEKRKESNFAFLNPDLLNILFFIWVTGMLFLSAYQGFSMLWWKKKLRRAVLWKGNIYECENIPSPFVMGIFLPKIYLPFRMEEKEREYILMHERYHIKRKDYLVKLFALLLTCIYWFHPLVWLAFFLMVRDMEMSCDEYVLKNAEEDIRKCYSKSLLGFAVNKRGMTIGVLAFGESDVERRVKNVLNFKKHGKWLGFVAAAILVVIAAICLTDAKSDSLKKPADKKEEKKTGKYEILLANTEIQGYEVHIVYLSDTKIPSKKELESGIYEGDFQIQTYPLEQEMKIQDMMSYSEQVETGEPIGYYEYDDKKNSDADSGTYTFQSKSEEGEEQEALRRKEKRIDTYNLSPFDGNETLAFPTEGFYIEAADYDGDGSEDDFTLGQGQNSAFALDDFMSYQFFGIEEDGTIFPFRIGERGEDVIRTKEGGYSERFEVKNGKISYYPLNADAAKTRTVKLQSINYRKVEQKILEDTQRVLPEEMQEEVKKNGVIKRVAGGHYRLLNNADVEKAGLCFDFYYQEDTLLQFTSRSDGFAEKMPDKNMTSAQAAELVRDFARVFHGFQIEVEDIRKESDDQGSEEYAVYSDGKYGRYLVWLKKGLIVHYVYEDIHIGDYCEISFSGLDMPVMLPEGDGWIQDAERLDDLDGVTYYDGIVASDVTVLFWRNGGYYQSSAKKTKAAVPVFEEIEGSGEQWEIPLKEKMEGKKYITVKRGISENGEDMVMLTWDIYHSIEFCMYASIKRDTDYISLARAAAYMTEEIYKGYVERKKDDIYYKNLGVHICLDAWGNNLQVVSTGVKNLGMAAYEDKHSGAAVRLRFWKKKDASYQWDFNKKVLDEHDWSIIVGDGKPERRIKIQHVRDLGFGDELYTLEWEFHGMKFFMYAMHIEDADYSTFAKAAADMTVKWYRIMQKEKK